MTKTCTNNHQALTKKIALTIDEIQDSLSLESLYLESYGLTLDANTYIDNSASKQNGIINIINVKKLRISNETYINNTDAFFQKSTILAQKIIQEYIPQDTNQEINITGIDSDFNLAASLIKIQRSRFVDINLINFDSNYLIEPNSSINRAQTIFLTDIIDGSQLSIIQTNTNTYQLTNSSYDNWYLKDSSFRQNSLLNIGGFLGIPLKSNFPQSQKSFNLIHAGIEFQQEAYIQLMNTQFLNLNFNKSEGTILGIQSGTFFNLIADQCVFSEIRNSIYAGIVFAKISVGINIEISNSFINTFESYFGVGGIINLQTNSASLKVKNTLIQSIHTNGTAPFCIITQDYINIQVSSNTLIKNVVGGQDGGIFFVSTEMLDLTIQDSEIKQIFTNGSGGLIYIQPNDHLTNAIGAGGIQFLNSQIGDIYANQGSIIYFNASLVEHDLFPQPLLLESTGNFYEFFNYQQIEWVFQNFPIQISELIFQTLGTVQFDQIELVDSDTLSFGRLITIGGEQQSTVYLSNSYIKLNLAIAVQGVQLNEFKINQMQTDSLGQILNISSQNACQVSLTKVQLTCSEQPFDVEQTALLLLQDEVKTQKSMFYFENALIFSQLNRIINCFIAEKGAIYQTKNSSFYDQNSIYQDLAALRGALGYFDNSQVYFQSIFVRQTIAQLGGFLEIFGNSLLEIKSSQIETLWTTINGTCIYVYDEQNQITIRIQETSFRDLNPYINQLNFANQANGGLIYAKGKVNFIANQIHYPQIISKEIPFLKLILIQQQLLTLRLNELYCQLWRDDLSGQIFSDQIEVWMDTFCKLSKKWGCAISLQDGGSFYIDSNDMQFELLVLTCQTTESINGSGGFLYIKEANYSNINNLQLTDSYSAQNGSQIYTQKQGLQFVLSNSGFYQVSNKAVNKYPYDSLIENSGGITLLNTKSIILSYNQFDGNSISKRGGAIFVQGGYLSVLGCNFQYLYAFYGAAMFLENVEVAVFESLVIETSLAKYQGGAIFIKNPKGDIKILDSVFNKVVAENEGGCVYYLVEDMNSGTQGTTNSLFLTLEFRNVNMTKVKAITASSVLVSSLRTNVYFESCQLIQSYGETINSIFIEMANMVEINNFYAASIYSRTHSSFLYVNNVADSVNVRFSQIYCRTSLDIISYPEIIWGASLPVDENQQQQESEQTTIFDFETIGQLYYLDRDIMTPIIVKSAKQFFIENMYMNCKMDRLNTPRTQALIIFQPQMHIELIGSYYGIFADINSYYQDCEGLNGGIYSLQYHKAYLYNNTVIKLVSSNS
ncbi:UNKNOWN [Stylonychia lemnae]|uniref:Right handed beta helix domain-containing protein n=1 Tax=Stylonychia lemnae TaxID=5949 RepID=A0A077ZNK9_STYLE|nr:UNKNOWN [Stylonychia lemnae]|eukprot:CDW71562.1 UNKNOWN [Stylonychia lemnae]